VERQLIDNGTQLNHELIFQDFDEWIDDWIGFRSFVDDYFDETYTGVLFREDAKDVFANFPKEQWEDEIYAHSANALGKIAMIVSLVMEHLRSRLKQEKFKDILEDIAKRDGNYINIADQFDENDEETYHHKRPGLYQFASSYFYQIFRSVVNSDQNLVRHQEILERSDEKERIILLIEEFRLPFYFDFKDGMYTLIALFNYLQTEEAY